MKYLLGAVVGGLATLLYLERRKVRLLMNYPTLFDEVETFRVLLRQIEGFNTHV